MPPGGSFTPPIGERGTIRAGRALRTSRPSPTPDAMPTSYAAPPRPSNRALRPRTPQGATTSSLVPAISRISPAASGCPSGATGAPLTDGGSRTFDRHHPNFLRRAPEGRHLNPRPTDERLVLDQRDDTPRLGTVDDLERGHRLGCRPGGGAGDGSGTGVGCRRRDLRRRSFEIGGERPLERIGPAAGPGRQASERRCARCAPVTTRAPAAAIGAAALPTCRRARRVRTGGGGASSVAASSTR